MNVDNLLEKGNEIWGKQNLSLSEIIIKIGVVYGDVCRYQRNSKSDSLNHNQEELKKELGNLIFSTILWCNDLGFNPKECINLAIKCQEKFKK
jgi:NTP pyrophosphatase (non-canonical NTP hydrolase)